MSFANASQMLITCNDTLKDILKQVRLLYEDLKDTPSEADMHASAQILSFLLSTSDRHTDAVEILIDQVIVGDPIMRAQINLLIDVVCQFAEMVAAGVSSYLSRLLACCSLTYTVKC